jgi:hypothetical protein
MQSLLRRNLAPFPGPAREINIAQSLDKSFNILNSSELRESRSELSDWESGTDLRAEMCRVLVKSTPLKPDLLPGIYRISGMSGMSEGVVTTSRPPII